MIKHSNDRIPVDSKNSNAQMKLNQACYKPRQLKIMSLNIFTLLKHLDELRVLAEQHEPDILAINETKIDTDIDDQEILIDGYHVERLDRNKFGGGVVIYMRKGIDYKVRNDLMIYDLESISVEVKIGMHKPFIVTSLYSPNHRG